MKIPTAIVTIAAAMSFALTPANASGKGPGAAATSQGSDLSAAKKKVRSDVHLYPGQYGYYYPQAFAPGDPSWQSPELIRRRAIGECVIDLGYGRYESCDSAGRGGR